MGRRRSILYRVGIGSSGWRAAIQALEAEDFATKPDQSPRAWLRLQLAFELVEKSPIRVLGDDLVRKGFDHARFVQPQSIVSHCVLGIIFPPFVVRDLAQRLQGQI